MVIKDISNRYPIHFTQYLWRTNFISFQIHLHNMHYIKQCAECCWIIYCFQRSPDSLPFSSLKEQRGLICVRLYRHRATLRIFLYIQAISQVNKKKISRLHIGFWATYFSRARDNIFLFSSRIPVWKDMRCICSAARCNSVTQKSGIYHVIY